MSLLLKALRQAEQANASNAPAAGEKKLGAEDLALEQISANMTRPKREWVEPPGLEAPPLNSEPPRERRWPLGLVPTTALLATLIAAGYGVYLYLMTRPQPWGGATPTHSAPAMPAAALPSASAPADGPASSSLAQVPAAADGATTGRATTDPSAAKPATASQASVALPLAKKPLATARPVAPTSRRVPQPPSAADITIIAPAPRLNLLEQAYAAFQSGRLDEARALYQRSASTNKNVQALLGLAAVAQAEGQTSEAIRLYQTVLEESPRNTIAQAALLDTLGTTDPAAAESQLKNMIAREPSGFLFYALGNLYASQARWSDAEHAYFDAHRREPGNADYAFNLAVSLDHLKQAAAAAGYYETALKLAGPSTRFDRAEALKRLELLK